MGAIFNSRVLSASAANIPETVGGHLSSLMRGVNRSTDRRIWLIF